MIFLLQSFTYHNFEGARHKFTTRWSRDVTGVTHTISRRANRFEAMQCCCLSCVCLKHLASMSHKTGVPNRWYIAEVTGVTYKGRDLLTVADRLQSSCVPRLSATTKIASPYPTGVDLESVTGTTRNSRYTANQRWPSLSFFLLQNVCVPQLYLGCKACLTGVGVAGRYLCHTYKFHHWSTGADLMQRCCLPVVCRNVFLALLYPTGVGSAMCYRCNTRKFYKVVNRC